MNNLDLLKCCICSSCLIQFVVLACNHTICGQCFSSYGESGSSFTIINCPCGLTTNMPTHKNYDRKSSLHPCSNIPYIKRNKSQILDQSTFTIFSGSQTCTIAAKNSKILIQQQEYLKPQKYSNLTTYLTNQLQNQIKFIQLRFKRYLNQINRCYTKLISQINKNYQSMIASATSKCKIKIEMNQIKSLADIQNYIQKAWKPNLQQKLVKISIYFSKLMQPDSRRSSSKHKQNKNENFNNYQLSNSKPKPKKTSTHLICKNQQYDNYISQIKMKTKQSKISKRRCKKVGRDKLLVQQINEF